MDKYIEFLKNVELKNEQFSSIYVDSELHPLSLSFWAFSEIQDGLLLRDEWNVNSNLIPFYGDWHDLICLNDRTAEIHFLNDAREVMCAWESIEAFTKSLSKEDVDLEETEAVVVSATPEFEKMIAEFKEKTSKKV